MLNLLQLPQETNTLSDKLIFSLKVVSFYCTLSETPNCNICSSLPSLFLTKLVPAGFLSLAAYAPENVDSESLHVSPHPPQRPRKHTRQPAPYRQKQVPGPSLFICMMFFIAICEWECVIAFLPGPHTTW